MASLLGLQARSCTNWEGRNKCTIACIDRWRVAVDAVYSVYRKAETRGLDLGSLAPHTHHRPAGAGSVREAEPPPPLPRFCPRGCRPRGADPGPAPLIRCGLGTGQVPEGSGIRCGLGTGQVPEGSGIRCGLGTSQVPEGSGIRCGLGTGQVPEGSGIRCGLGIADGERPLPRLSRRKR